MLDVLLQKLTGIKAATEAALTERSPLQRYEDVEKDLRDKWEEELTASIEAEYRRQRTDLVVLLQRWFRDVWVETLVAKPESSGLLNYPRLGGARKVAQRISSKQAVENLQVMENLQRLLHTNVQEALALEVGLLKLHL